MQPYALAAERTIALSSFVTSETEQVPVDPTEQHDPSGALAKENPFDHEW